MNQLQALKIMKTGANIFLTGEPGSGKTHTINTYVDYLRSCGIEPAITASTGIAATHIGGMTIHSWSGIGIQTSLDSRDLNIIASNDKINKRINNAKILIIDEISMLPQYALNMVEAVCRKIKGSPEPFGGLQIILVGDFFQLPPIMKTNYGNSQGALLANLEERFAYGSVAWRSAKPIVCYLGEQYRQDDANFLDLLTGIRANNFNETHLNHLRQRKITYAEAPSGLPKLYSHNIDVDRVNNEMLAKLPGKSFSYKMTGQGAKPLIETLKRGCLSPEILELKVGASVMFTKNSPKGAYANGTLGKIEKFESAEGLPVVLAHNGVRIVVEPAEWILEEGGEPLARVTQLPLRLAWAITVHKSQGMSLDGAVMDLSSVFEYGQGYVALSRVRRLSGLHLLGWNSRAFEVHPDIVEKDVEFKASSASDLMSFAEMPTSDLEQMHSAFIKYSGGTPGQPVVKKSLSQFKQAKVNTGNETLALWKAGKSLAEIGKARGLKADTILAHLEKLGIQGKIKPEEFKKLIPADLIKVLPEIQQAFRELDTTKLGAVYEYLNGAYSYDDLKLVRLTLRRK